MRLGLAVVLLSGLLIAMSGMHAADQPAAEPAWPQANGPFGNFNPRRYGCKVLDDISQAKAVWTSEESDLGYGKRGSSGFIGNRANWPGHPGSANALIAA